MKQCIPRMPLDTPTARVWMATLALVFATALAVLSPAQAQDADKILKAMSDYMTSQQTISLTFDTDIEIITPDIQKIQFTNSGQLLLHRPDKLRASRVGGYADVELIFDGKTFTVYGKHQELFAQTEAVGTVDELIDRLRNELHVALSGADLLVSGMYDKLMADVIDAKHIGRGVIDGIECEHLAFRNPDVDWQLWVEVGPRPIPRKYVITSKTMASGPQYTLRIKDWQTDVQASAEAFAFKPPADAKKVELESLREIDELPPGVVKGGAK